MMADTDAVGLDHNPILTDTAAKVTMTPTEAIPSYVIGTTKDFTGVVHADHIQVLIHTILTTTLYNEDNLHAGAYQPTQETAVDHALD